MSKKVFGSKLADVMARTEEEGIPRCCRELFSWIIHHGLGVEGLFRVSAGVKEMDDIKSKYDREFEHDWRLKQFLAGLEAELDKIHDPHLVAGVLKAYFIELPEPLFTFALYDKFIEAVDAGPDLAQRIRQLLSQLPGCNQVLAQCLFLFLLKCAEKAEQNKMNTMNLAIVFGQILLRPKVETLELLRHATKITHTLKFMIDNYYDVFKLSPQEERAMASGELTMAESMIGIEKQKTICDEDPANLTPEQLKLRNVKNTVDEAITMVLDRLDSMSADLGSTTSLDETIEIAKRVRTAKRVLFAGVDASAS